MAFYFENGPSSADIAASFAENAAKGRKYMLIVDETISDPMAVHSFLFTHAIDSQAEILPLIKKLEGRSVVDAAVSLTGIFDLSRDYESQARQSYSQLDTVLDPAVKKELDAKTAARQLKAAQAEWDAQPILWQLFNKRPSARVLKI